MKAIMDLRTEARTRLGSRFNIKEFHAVVLENGAVPLWLLRQNVEAWIAAKAVGK